MTPKRDPSFRVPPGFVQALIQLAMTAGTIWVLVNQGASTNRIAELKAAAEEQRTLSTENQKTLKSVHDQTNSTLLRGEAKLDAQAAELKELRATVTRLQTMLEEQQKGAKK